MQEQCSIRIKKMDVIKCVQHMCAECVHVESVCTDACVCVKHRHRERNTQKKSERETEDENTKKKGREIYRGYRKS